MEKAWTALKGVITISINKYEQLNTIRLIKKRIVECTNKNLCPIKIVEELPEQP